MTNPIKFEWAKVSLSDVVQVLLILGMIYAGWMRFDQRVTDVEKLTRQNTQSIDKQNEVMEKLDRTLGELQLTLQTFPLHKHLDNGDILLSNGQEVSDDGKAH